jgi:tetratricopeptide (TPR) repeat protein
MASTLADAANQARKRSREGASSAASVSVDRRFNLVKSLLNSLRFEAARKELERITDQFPDHPEGIFLFGQSHHRFGEEDQAIACYERAISMGVEDATKWLNEIQYQRAIALDLASSKPNTSSDTIDEIEPSKYVMAASLSDECGWPGRALATLERANKRFPNQPSIQRPLADLYRRFARSDLAVPLYESAMSQDSTDELAQKGLTIARANLREPQMRSRKERSTNSHFADISK